MKRRERTRQLIELGGLIAKAGLIELTDDDRAVIFGALVEVAALLWSDQREEMIALWRRRGRRAFANESPARAGTEAEIASNSDVHDRPVRDRPDAKG